MSFSDKKLKAIQEKLEKEIYKVWDYRNNTFKELTSKKTKLMDDLDYLKSNKLKFLKEWTYTWSEYNEEKQKILNEMKNIDKMFNIQTETEEEMLKFVEDFSELIVKDWWVASYKAKEGFQELLDNNFKKPPEMASGRVWVGRYREKNQEDFSIGESYVLSAKLTQSSHVRIIKLRFLAHLARFNAPDCFAILWVLDTQKIPNKKNP